MKRPIRIATLAEVPSDGRVRCFDAGSGRRVALCTWKGEVIATAPTCPHQLAPLDEEGEVEEGELICFRHGWAFDLRTGECDAAPDVRLEVYPVRVEGGEIWVELP